MSLNPVTDTKKKFGNRNTWRRPCEDGGLRDALQTKEFQRLPANPRGLEEERKDFPTAFRRSMALTTPSFQNRETIDFCCSEALSYVLCYSSPRNPHDESA